MKVRIKRFDQSLPLPSYQSAGAVCVDLCARIESRIAPQTIGYIPLNVALEIPEGYWVLLAARSSTHKRGIMVANGIGIGDTDFKGDNDEYQLPAFNITQHEVVVAKGTRIAQLMVLPVERIEFEEVASLASPNRGGFGTTGTK